jgi:acyl dehydratase
MDHEFAKTTLYRKPIAHGLLVFSMGSGLGLMFPPMRTLAFLSIKEWHFREAVFIGDTLRVKARVVEKEERSRGRRGVITWQRQILNQDHKIVQEGMTVTMVEGRAAAGASPSPAS